MSATPPHALRRRLRHSLEYQSVRCIAWVLRLLPRPMALSLGAGIGRLGWWLRLRRALVLANLQQALPELAASEQRRIGALAARNFGRTSAEFLRFSGSDRKRVSELVAIAGLDELEAARSAAGGALIVTGHLGAWALYVTALAAAGTPATLLVGAQHNRQVDELILGIPGAAVRFVSKGKSSPRELLESLREGRVIVMVADHYSSDQQVLVPFLGRDAYTLPLPGALVAKYGLPLFCMTGHRTEDGTHALKLGRVTLPDSESLERDSGSGGDAAARDLMRLAVSERSNQCLGDAICERPEQYFWYHDRWKSRKYARGPRFRGGAGADRG